MKPLIGITVEGKRDEADARSGGSMTLNWNYAQVVSDAGGVPLIIPPMADMAAVSKVIHGWLIPGGSDIDPGRYGEAKHPEAKLQDPSRYEGEAALYKAAPLDLPILGICYGCQFLNVVRGGSLDQHIPDQLGHTRHEGGTVERHRVEPSQLARLLQTDEVEGRSYHHQAIARVGEGLRITSRDHEGVIEAVEAEDRPWLIGVQWHPERTATDPVTNRLFVGFIDAARQYAGREKVVGTW